MKKDRTYAYSALQMFFWMFYGVAFGFTSVYLLPAGLTNTQIGMLTAAACLAAALLQPAAAAWADDPKGPSLRALLFGFTGLYAACAALLIAAGGRIAAVSALLYGVCVACIQIALPLLIALGMDTINQGLKLNFGLARGLGSGAYAVIVYVCGIAANRLGEGAVPAVMLMMSLCFLAVLAGCYPLKKAAASKDSAPSGGSPIAFLRRYPKFALMLAGWILIYIDHSFINNFTYQIAVSKGGTSEDMGLMMSIGAAAELPIMLLFAPLVKRVRCETLMRASAVFFALKALGSWLAPNMALLYAAQLLQMGAWGLVCVASVYYVNGIMAPSDTAKGQAYMTTVMTLATVFGSLTGGMLIDAGGAGMMLAVGTVSAVIGLAVVLSGVEKMEIK